MKCPFCKEDLKIVDVDFAGFDVLGCDECDWKPTSNDDEMEFFI